MISNPLNTFDATPKGKEIPANELIKVHTENGNSVVSARELHVFLESKQEFANWIKNRIKKYGFIENQDYEVFDKFIKNSNGGRPETEYALTLDTAKEIAMVEGNEKGRQARRYFIEAERQFKAIASPEQIQALQSRVLALEEKQIDFPNDWTVDRYLRVNKLMNTLSDKERPLLGRQCTKAYKIAYGKPPKSVPHPSFINGQNVYPYQLLHEVYTSMMAAQKGGINNV